MKISRQDNQTFTLIWEEGDDIPTCEECAINLTSQMKELGMSKERFLEGMSHFWDTYETKVSRDN